MADAVALAPAAGVGRSRIEAVLLGELGCRRDGGGPVVRTYFDTFDHRIGRAGLVVEHERIEGTTWLRVRRPGRSAPLAQAVVDTVSGPVAALPDLRLRRLLEGPAGGRVLLPLLRCEGELRRFALTDGHGRTTVQISLALLAAGSPPRPGSARYLLGPVIGVVAVPGHDAARERVVLVLTRHLGVRPAVEPASVAAAALGTDLTVDPTGRPVVLDGAAPASVSVRHLLQRDAAAIEDLLPGVRAQLDTEFLHDLRVVLRRSRTVVAAAAGVLPAERRDTLTAGLRQLADRSGPVRDLDMLAAAGLGDLPAPLRSVLGAARERARTGLLEVLDGPDLVPLLTLLRSGPGLAPGPESPVRTATWAAGATSVELRRLYRRVRAADLGPPVPARVVTVPAVVRLPAPMPYGRPLPSGTTGPAGAPGAPGAGDPGDGARYHEVRKAAKRLRSLLRSVGSLDGAGHTRSLQRLLVAIQAELGAQHDALVIAGLLENAARQVSGAGVDLASVLHRSEQQRAVASQAAVRYRPLGDELRHRRERFLTRLAALDPGADGDRSGS